MDYTGSSKSGSYHFLRGGGGVGVMGGAEVFMVVLGGEQFFSMVEMVGRGFCH